jgi:endoglucanase
VAVFDRPISPLPDRVSESGSVEVVLNTAVICLFAAEMGEAPARDTAQRLLDYVLGCNALNHGFVSHGERATRRPYHWTCRVRGIVMPGWASGGPNGGRLAPIRA